MEGREVEAIVGAVIGREGVDIVLPDPEASRRHAAIREHGDGIAIEDLGSTNGTFVNGEKVQGVKPLSDGDTIRIGNTVLRLQAPVAADAGATRIGQAQVAAPQVTAARAVPTEAQPPAPQPTTARQTAAAPAASAPQAPAQPGAPSPAAVGARGDVPAPAAEAPSAVRRILPAPTAGQAPAFSPPGQRKITSRSGSAATRVDITVVCMIAVIAVAVVLAIYFISQS